MQTTWRNVRVLVLLGMLAYLGFYFYGLILGVFSPLELVGCTVVAAGSIVAIILIWLRWRFGSEDGSEEEVRAMHRYRERRGF